jgi:hypothetical protein
MVGNWLGGLELKYHFVEHINKFTSYLLLEINQCNHQFDQLCPRNNRAQLHQIYLHSNNIIHYLAEYSWE